MSCSAEAKTISITHLHLQCGITACFTTTVIGLMRFFNDTSLLLFWVIIASVKLIYLSWILLFKANKLLTGAETVAFTFPKEQILACFVYRK